MGVCLRSYSFGDAPDQLRRNARGARVLVEPRVAPLYGERYQIEAWMPSPEIAAMLHITEIQPCLVLRRETRSRGQSRPQRVY